MIDGYYAQMASELRVLFGPATYAHAAAEYRANSADDSALDSLMRVAGGVRVSPHVPAVATKVQGLVIAKGVGRRNMVAPVWEGVTLIPDEVTKAKTGRSSSRPSCCTPSRFSGGRVRAEEVKVQA